MSMCVNFIKKLVRKKIFTDDDIETTDLKRCLTTFDLIGLGIGSTLGTGIYIVTGQVAKETAGPAVVLSYFIAGIASAFAGICYAEFAARVPRAGSAYVYSYVTVGELMAFVIGWNLLLEYIIGTASVARAWSTYFDSLIDKKIETFFRDNMPMNVTGLSGYPDFFAFGITLFLTGILAIGVKESTRFNNIFTCVNLLVISYVVICGFFKADAANWSLSGSELPDSGAGTGGFLPFGLSGMMSGAATCFYAYVGFDCIATTGEETNNPQKSIPIGIVVALVVISLAYCSVAAVVTLMCPYFLIDVNAPLPFIFERVGWGVARYIITVGALCGLSTSLLGAMFPLPRVLYAMGSDGLIFRFMAKVSQRFQTPLIGTFVSGAFAGVMAMMFNLKELVDMMSIGTLLAYTLVAVCVLILRYERDENLPKMNSRLSLSQRSSRLVMEEEPFSLLLLFKPSEDTPTALSAQIVKCCVGIMCVLIAGFCATTIFMETWLTQLRWYAIAPAAVMGVSALLCLICIIRQPQNTTNLNFKVPLVPYIPAVSCLVNIYLMLKLSAMTWLRFGVWMLIGFCIYFFYGIWHSGLNVYENHVLLGSRKDLGSNSYTLLNDNHPQDRGWKGSQRSEDWSSLLATNRSSSNDGLEESVH